ncbi:hypothetical protein [Algibacter sp.]|uniref:hypothetical protein n=1 Tax=Algibacter sp. TaxID=1872428 RepID=UPI003C71BA6D
MTIAKDILNAICKKSIAILLLVITFCDYKPKQIDKDIALQPMLLFIFADQYRQDSLGFLNEAPLYLTNLDKLRKEANGFYSFNASPGFGLEIDTDRLKKVSELYIEV